MRVRLQVQQIHRLLRTHYKPLLWFNLERAADSLQLECHARMPLESISEHKLNTLAIANEQIFFIVHDDSIDMLATWRIWVE